MVETLEQIAVETHDGEPETYYECPDCGKPVAEWCDCAWCAWYDVDMWENAVEGAA